jgi:hypothetical protein
MSNGLIKGLTFWRSDASGKEHLCFVISDICKDDNSVLVVNMTTFRNIGLSDLSCVLDVGDHPAVKHKSYIIYEMAKIFSVEKILNDTINGKLRKDCKIDDALLKRIQDGAKKSDLLPEKFEKYFECF